MVTEPVWTWSFILTVILIPIGLFLLYTSIKRLLAKKDKEDDKKETKVEQLLQEKEELKDAANVYAHNVIAEKLEELNNEMFAYRNNTREMREEIMDKLKTIEITVKLTNGSVQACQKEITVHKADRHAHSRD